MRRGRKPKPTHLKVISGMAAKNPQRVNRAEPKPPRSVPAKPDYLDARASEKWDEMTALLDQMGILTTADGDLVALYCVTYSAYRTALENVNRTGQVLVTRQQDGKTVEVKRNPFSTEFHKYADKLMRLQLEMGLTPSARTRISVTKSQTVDPLLEMRNRHLGGA